MFFNMPPSFAAVNLQSHLQLNPSSPEETEGIKWILILKREDFELRRRMCCPWSQPSNYLHTTVYFTPEFPHSMSEHCDSLEWGIDVATVVTSKTTRADRMYSTYPQPKSSPMMFSSRQSMTSSKGQTHWGRDWFYPRVSTRSVVTDNFPQIAIDTINTSSFFFGAFILHLM